MKDSITIEVAGDISAAQSGDQEAFGRLVRRYEKMLLAFAGCRIPHPDEAREAVQDTFVRAWQQMADFRSDGDFGVWLRSICRYMVLSRVKSYLRRKKKETDVHEQIFLLAARQMNRPPEEPDTDLSCRLEECMKKLPARQQTLIADRYLHSLSTQTLSEKNGRTVTWVTSTLYRVRNVLRACIEKKTTEK